MSDFLRVIIVLLIVLGNGFFVVAEYSLVTAKRAKLDELARHGSRRARIAVRLIDEPVRLISTAQLGITVFSILLGAVGEPLLEHFFDPVLATTLAFVFSFTLVTWLHVVLGELVPKALALWRREPIALLVAMPLEGLYLVAYPIVRLLQWSANALLLPFGIKPAAAGVIAADEAEIRMMVAQAEDTGIIEEAEEEMLYKVFDFADKEVHDVMVTRPEVVALSVDLPTQEALAAVVDSPFTRYPVYRGSLDDLVGILHVRDLFGALYDDGIENVRIEGLVRPAHVVPETKNLGALLTEFRKTKQHVALVVDEYGSFMGMVTLEDLLEEIVGEIEDEYDLPDESVQRLDETHVRIDGTFPIDDFNEQFAQELPQEDFHTIAGFVFGALGRQPEEGDEVAWNRLRFTVVQVEGTRIERLDVEFLPAAAEPEREGG